MQTFEFKVIGTYLLTLASLAWAGPGEVGGGSILHSSETQVLQYMTTVQLTDVYSPRLGLAADLEKFTNFANRTLKEYEDLPVTPKVRILLRKMNHQVDALNKLFSIKPLTANRQQPLIYLPEDFGIKIIKDGSICQSREKKKGIDACYDDRSDAIYLILPRLMKYPPSLLSSVIYPLVIHEMAHKAGLNEEDAQWLQNYFSTLKESTVCRFEVDFHPPEDGDFGKISELHGGRITVEFSDIALNFSTIDFTPNVKGIASGGNVTSSWHSTFKVTGPFTDSPKWSGGNISAYKINWNSDFSGQLEFDALDMNPHKGLTIVRDVLKWDQPQNPSELYDFYGGLRAQALPGSEITFKGRKFTPNSAKIRFRFYGNCFQR